MPLAALEINNKNERNRKGKRSNLLRGSMYNSLFANFYEHFLILTNASSSRIDEFLFEEFLAGEEKEEVSFQFKR